MTHIPDEETKETLKKSQGDAYADALEYLSGIVDYSDSKFAGDYKITLAAEEAEGLYFDADGSGKISWQPPTDEQNQHIEIVVQDKDDHRFIPSLVITAEVFDERGESLGIEPCPFLWHPYIFHYGSMWTLPSDGKYTVIITIKKPVFGRHDEILGKRYLNDEVVTFEGVELNLDRETSGPE